MGLNKPTIGCDYIVQPLNNRPQERVRILEANYRYVVYLVVDRRTSVGTTLEAWKLMKPKEVDPPRKPDQRK